MTREFKEFGSELESSVITLQYIHQNYVFKIPIYCYNQATNYSGLLMTSLAFCAANGLAYYSLKKYKEKKSIDKNKEYIVHFASFQSRMHKAEEYIQKNELFFN
jgi:hypothetical protein